MRRLVKLLPLLDTFLKSSSAEKKAAGKEVFVTCIFSFIPIFLATCVVVLRSPQDNPATFFDAYQVVVGRGELLLYSSSILAPIMYLVLHEPNGKQRLNERLTQGVLGCLMLILSYCFYGLNYSGIVNNLDFLLKSSYWMLGVAIVLWYFATVFRNMMTGGFDLRTEEEAFTKKVFEHRGEG